MPITQDDMETGFRWLTSIGVFMAGLKGLDYLRRWYVGASRAWRRWRTRRRRVKVINTRKPRKHRRGW